jgi:hypothetical protein
MNSAMGTHAGGGGGGSSKRGSRFMNNATGTHRAGHGSRRIGVINNAMGTGQSPSCFVVIPLVPNQSRLVFYGQCFTKRPVLGHVQ